MMLLRLPVGETPPERFHLGLLVRLKRPVRVGLGRRLPELLEKISTSR